MTPRTRPWPALLLLAPLACGRSDLSVLDTISSRPGAGGQAGSPPPSGQAGTTIQGGHAGAAAPAGTTGHAGTPGSGGKSGQGGASAQGGTPGQGGCAGKTGYLSCEDGQLSYQGVENCTLLAASSPGFRGSAFSSSGSGIGWNLAVYGGTSFFHFSGPKGDPLSNTAILDRVFGRVEEASSTGSWFCGRGESFSSYKNEFQFSLPALTFLGACPGGEPVAGSLEVRHCDLCSTLQGTVDGTTMSDSSVLTTSWDTNDHGSHGVMTLEGEGRMFVRSPGDGTAEGVLLLPQKNSSALTFYCLGPGSMTKEPGSLFHATFSSISRLGVCPADTPNGSLEGCF